MEYSRSKIMKTSSQLASNPKRISGKVTSRVIWLRLAPVLRAHECARRFKRATGSAPPSKRLVGAGAICVNLIPWERKAGQDANHL